MKTKLWKKLLNKVYEKGLRSIFPQICVALWIFVSVTVSAASVSIYEGARKINYESVIEAFVLKRACKAGI